MRARWRATSAGTFPGNPTVIFKSMPGAGSLVAANHLFHVAPKDGTALGFISATIPLEELLGVAGVKFKAAEFNWIGRIAPGVNMTFVKDTSPVKIHPGRLQARGDPGRLGAKLHGLHLSGGAQQRDRCEVQDGDGLSGLARGDAGDGARRGRRPFDQPGDRQVPASDLAEREEDHHPGAVCAHAASGAAGCPDVVGAWPQSGRAADSQARRQCNGSRKDDHGAARTCRPTASRRCGGRSTPP